MALAKAKPAKAPEVTTPTMQKYLLKKSARLLQPSTGIYIVRDTVTELKKDSWADLQVSAGLMQVVK